MGQLLIQKYLNELSDLKKFSGTNRENVVREAFKTLLKDWGRSHDLVFVTEYEIITPAKERRFIDGALLHELRVPFGYWEAKDEKDNLDAEIELKFKRGYPQDNIIFEDSRQAVLIQNKQEVMRCATEKPKDLEKLLKLFFGYERHEIAEFRKAIEQFTKDLPAVLKALRDMINEVYQTNAEFVTAAEAFLKHAQKTINPSLTDADVREMLIQHILTEDIFSKVFGEDDFHRLNNIANKLYNLEEIFFTGGLKKKTLKSLEPYYAAIRAAAAQISSHHEKQSFLKIIYENFYKVYNPKAADRLGVIYTPNEIVRFMVESADWLCRQHFGKLLIDKNVEILDPATGTGTFITELLEHFRGQEEKLKYKYLNELYANEVAILPYYVANLNIEATYATLTGDYKEFSNLCFVDTLDNVRSLRTYTGRMENMFGGLSDENIERIRRQNGRKISVIIGNPPYNANQLNENENNKNRKYPDIDERIRKTYIAHSSAQLTKCYDMYARFFRWASDRLDNNGIIAFVSNSSFIDSKTFDGFRKIIEQEFNEIWIIDLKGNARTRGEQRKKEGGNIFYNQIRVGIAVYFCIKKENGTGCNIYYQSVKDYAKADEKHEFLKYQPLSKRKFEQIKPDCSFNWINISDNDFNKLIPIANKQTKASKRSMHENAIFKLFGNGVNTARDEWVTDLCSQTLKNKVDVFLEEFYKHPKDSEEFNNIIKWSRNLKSKLKRGIKENRDNLEFRKYAYRPYFIIKIAISQLMIDELGQSNSFNLRGNKTINLSIGKEFICLASNVLTDFHFTGDTKVIGRFRLSKDGKKVDNITDWGLNQFQSFYNKREIVNFITKDNIFYYVYGVLHDPLYRNKYELNLRREFPRIPLYDDFWQWANWGETLMNLHIEFETVEPWPLQRIDVPDIKSREAGLIPKAKMEADKDMGLIVLDSETTLTGIPKTAWDYKLGNRSALEWILDQYKEKKPKDPTIREKFNNYRFADYKDHVIDLISRVTRVSVETQKIVEAMKTTVR